MILMTGARAFALLAILSTTVAVSAGCAAEDEVVDSSESEVSVRPSPFWKDKLAVPTDPFIVSSDSGQPRWVKLTMFVSEPTKVYFQDSNKYAFHYDFAKNHLPGFSRMTAEEFGRVALAKAGQKVITGAVLLPPREETAEVGIQIIRRDVYTKEETKKLFDVIKGAITASSGTAPKAFYMPTFEQSRAAEAERAWFESNGVPLASPTRWLSGDACYSAGWAFGKVVKVPAAEIKAAYQSGRLKHTDILLTEGVPAEVPYVAGIVSLTPSTPNSHVAILASSFRVPFVFPAAQQKRDLMERLVGKEILLRAGSSTVDGSEGCEAEIHEVKGTVDAATRADLAALKRPAPLDIAPRTRLGALTKNAQLLKPADVKYFGGKAANFGTITRTVPTNARKALGISFDLWESFLAQTLPATGKTMKQEIDARLAGVTYPPDMPTLAPKLKEIRDLIEDSATFDAATSRALLDQLKAFPFDPKIKIRFRSSTNIEDSNAFTGAGLYESFSGCLADDLDADQTGASACDSAEPKERGVLRAIKKVYASFYGENAVFERLKYRLDENKVGMAVLAHYSFPDENEAANGVATVRVRSWGMDMDLVTQAGAESVTNPSGAALPEVVRTQPDGRTANVQFVRGSSLVQLGAKVMTWETDYREMTKLIEKISKAFLVDHGIDVTQNEAVLDVEYKKLKTGERIMKQIRLVPQPDTTPSLVPVLLDTGAQLCTAQGEFGDELANHRLKARITLAAKNAKLDAPALGRSLYTRAETEMIEGGRVVKKVGPFTGLVGFRHEVAPDPNIPGASRVRDAWKPAGRELTFDTFVSNLIAPAGMPAMVADELMFHFSATYATPRPSFRESGTTREEMTQLETCPEAEASPQVQVVDARGPGALRVKTQFRYAKSSGPYQKTASLGAWVKTEINGLVASPITLTGYFSQTFRPQHHNFDEDFVFEPALEPGIAPAILAELDRKDIQLLVMKSAVHGESTPTFFVLKKSTQKLEPLR